MKRTHRPIDFRRVAEEAARSAPAILAHWLPGGKRVGREFCALNPRRTDSRPGSFKINLATGAWADFASGDKGGDLVSLAAYLYGLDQRDAAIRVAEMCGVDPFER